MPSHVATFLWITLYIVIGGVGCVRVTDLRVPPEAVLGQPVRLVCRYDLGSEDLYVVKWYKDEIEFYRYEPKDMNQSVYFPQPGIDIDLSRSDGDAVFLKSVVLDSAGEYKCQVSTEAPTYSCVQAVKEMNVIVLPIHGPVVYGAEGTFDLGDNVTLNCTSAKSKPAARLKWIVNGRPVPDSATTDHGVTTFSDSLESRTVSLRLPLTEGHLRRGRLSARCEATFLGRTAMFSRDITIVEFDRATNASFQRCLFILVIMIALWPGFR